MHIIIVGAGNTGTQLARYLINEKHDVSIIESDEHKAKHISNRLDCIVVHNNGNNLNALKNSGITKADALVCVTESDEINMIICGLATSQFTNRSGKLLKIARVRNADYLKSYFDGEHVLGIDYLIHPGMEVARSIIKAIEHGVIGEIFSFSNTPYEMGAIDIGAGSAMDGLSLVDYRNLVTYESLVALVERGNDVTLPSGSTVLKSGDRIHVLADGKYLPDLYKIAGDIQKPIRKIGIVGGGELGSLIAEGLLNKNDSRFPLLKFLSPKSRRIVIIERDSKLCSDLAARFPSALILNEDISDESFVNEEELDDLDCLIATTSNEDLNIITAIFMKSRGVERTIALVAGSGHAAMARHLGVDIVIPKPMVVVDSIYSKLMGSGIKEVHSLGDGKVDLIEVEVGKDAPVIDKPISSFRLSAGGLLLLVNRGDESFIPKGGYVFKEGDRIVLIAGMGSKAEIEKYFKTGS